MKYHFNVKLLALCAILVPTLIVPSVAHTKSMEGKQFREQKVQMIKQLKLAPDKEKAVLAVGDKRVAEREGIIADLRKFHDDLEAALAEAKPDETKITKLVNAINTEQDKMFASFKQQKEEEMALMTPIEQGKYIMAIGHWHQSMIKQHQKESGKKK